ncbi:MAG TPA: hypothetical protein ENI93_06350, partial [Gammaproteobacteria bacterium]|nr:hypothetical protein [Gammaproteobacteria bacterium]
KRRAVEETPDTTIYTLYSQAGQLMYEYDYSNMIKKEYIRLGVNLVAVREDICDAGSTDTDGDGIPDCFEERVGLDPAKAADGAVDADGDGLTNLQEFQLKTDLFGADTDMDGIPDGFEVQNGLDPLKADAQADRDGDGYSNLQEYAGRSDLNDPTSIPNAAPRWSATLPGVASFPAIATDGTIYVLASDVATMTLHAFANDGTKLWARDLPVMAGGCQSLVDDTGEGPGLAGQVAVDRQGGIYASCDGGGTYQLDSAGNVIWSYPSGGFLAVTDDRVHIATVFTTNAEVHVLDTSGAPVWTYTNAAAPFGDSIVVGADGILYAVTGCNGWRAFECTGSGGSVDVYAIAKNGVLKWVRRDIGVVYGKPAIGFDGTLYIGARAPGVGESRLVALNPDGTFQRKSSQIRLDFEVGTSSGHSAPVLDKQGNVLSSIVFPGVYSPALQQINMVSVAPPPDESRAHSLLLAGMGRAYLSANGVIHAVDVSGASIWSSGILNDPNIGNLNIDPNGSFVVTSVGASTSTLYSATNNDGRIIEDSVWPIRGANPRQTRAIENCAGQDQDGDGLPDCYERWIGGDETDPGNAALDPDGDGLTNLDEYTAGTHPYLADSDGDLMPDGYERGRGLDPRSNGTLEDSDGDGAIDSIEFRLGTDPSDPSSVPQFGAQIWSLSADSAVTAAPVSEALGEPLFPGIGLVNHLGEVQFGWLGGALSVTPLVTGANRIIGSRNPPYQNLFAMPWVQPQLGMNHFWQTSAGGLIGPGFGLGANDVVYFGASPNTLYAIDSSGWSAVFSDHLIWSQTFAADVSTLPVVLSSGVVVVGTADGVVHALDGSGTELWSFAAMGAIRGSAAAGADDTIYVGSDDGRLYALRPDGTLAWSFTVGAVISTSPVIGGDGTVYVAAEDGFLYAVDATGVMRWSFQTGGAIRANPLIGSDNALYFGSDDGYVYAVQPDGSQAWRASTGVPVGDSSPYIDDKGVLYVGVSDNRLLGLYAGVKGLADTPWPTLGHDVHRTGNVSTRLAQPDQPPALTIVTPTAGQTVSVGDTVVFTAAAPDPEDGDLANAVSWSSSLDGPLGTGSPLNVSTLSVGTHVVTATVSDSGGNSVAVVVTLSVQQAAVVATLSTDVDSPQTVGALVTVSAVVSDTTTSYDYRFRVKGDATGDAWVLLSDYSAQSSVAWDTTAYPGRNRLQVSVRQTGTTGAVIRSGKTYWVNGVDAAQSVTLTSDKPSPQTVGQVVRLSGAASGGSGPYEYRFEVRSVTSNGSWQLLQDYSSQASVDWATNGYLGKNRVRVLARRAGSPDKPVREGRAYWINAPNAATGVDLTLTPDGTQASGTAIQLSAQGQ